VKEPARLVEPDLPDNRFGTAVFRSLRIGLGMSADVSRPPPATVASGVTPVVSVVLPVTVPVAVPLAVPVVPVTVPVAVPVAPVVPVTVPDVVVVDVVVSTVAGASAAVVVASVPVAVVVLISGEVAVLLTSFNVRCLPVVLRGRPILFRTAS